MPIEQIIILALIQGITEFLPVSSSAHLILAPVLTAWEDQGALIDVAAHLGSLGAVLIYFRRDTAAIVRGARDAVLFRNTDDRRLVFWLAAATIPLVGVGFLYAMLDGDLYLRSAVVIGWTSILFGVLLYAADIYCPKRLTVADMSWKSTILLGCAQALAAIPGTSRSGITITVARALGFTRPEAARYSMLMAIPAISAVSAYSILKLLEEGDIGQITDAGIVAGLSFLSAYVSIFLFMRLLQRMSMTPFVIYRIVLGVGLLAWAYGLI